MLSGDIEKLGNEVLIDLDNDLDATCNSVRTKEMYVGNLLCDATLAAVEADAVLLNSGIMRADKVFVKGPFRQRDLDRLLPYQTNLVVLGIKVQLNYCSEITVGESIVFLREFLRN